ncbi:CatA-like O-acetyltransferase [Megasphaera stantonii]|uniref:CatA-like O-acetyltransferase n=1 Tax=Megasphaera stantonii TaxID=2144175 RepID=UPI001DB4A0FF|nr:CatA-like O-acetyltransferase [Megasphaera stantonii]HJE82483.1 chloramphenicol acetyltransferase [Megasphaera stantonii]
MFHPIDWETWPRRDHFNYYYNQIKCRYTLTAHIDIAPLREFQNQRRLRFFPLMLYAIMRAVNENREFRMSFDGDGRLGYWDVVVPCYTVFHEEDKTFSDIWSEYDEDLRAFYDGVAADIETYKNGEGFVKAKPNQPPNFCPVSSVPWLHFTSFSQDTYAENSLLFPLIRFGKFEAAGKKVLLPLAVSVHHAVADGYHTCKLINDIEAAAARLDRYWQ